ncbi:MAG: PAS domain-containing protein [Kordiimonadaceae bacterium]|nr:PAS domain-containing protein [Kordiimonadaceae bacterium]MBO6569226.1 PAS domain-containing protein [Kordiimonadaceae bacterium]MBO6964702.1 PAS domain-containing protein [Kordiimonadaceae bacterium]
MQPEFKDFIAKWQRIAMRSGTFELPMRSDITVTGFAEHLPSLMIAEWDFDSRTPTTRYIGSRIEAAWRQDPSQVPIAAIFKDAAATKLHVEIARAVTSNQIAALVEGELVFDDNLIIPLAQLRLPLAPENGCPTIISLFCLPELQAGMAGKLPKLENLRHEFIPVKPTDELAAVV